ncbi:metal ABC transporter solute-binding protein, Zn/Mn family [Peribacillus acanthi]|uniref:metal ABC transporter solute-binding protein, Zn/Mn family n=1 Tax=Peribacillus acanthi TaxID=2171554 RepID=UPI000D3E14C7|nr:zinc ABC transporter substrate-binding protein [Peribacillus acanthi]
MKKILFSILLLLGVFLSGCNAEKNNPSDIQEKITVYTTVFPLEDFTKKIGGDYVQVNTVYPPGSDEHTFEPSQKDVIKMAQSNLFLYIGHNLEGFVEQSKDILEKEQVKTVAVGESIKIENLHHEENASEEHKHDEDGHDNHSEEASEEHKHEEDSHDNHSEEASEEHKHEEDSHDNHENEESNTEENHEEHEHSDVDPHLWLDPIYSISMAETIKNELVKLKPEQKEYFEKNYAELKNELEELNLQFEDTIKSAKTNKVIVSHAAYGYWENRYGLEQISISGLSSTSEPSQKQLKEIIEIAKENNIHYVLFEQNINSKLADIVQKEIGAKPLTLHNLSVLTEKDIKNKQDYLTLMKQNLETLKQALN